ncbi:MAG: M10 family metallopeptidase [Desulfuromonas sp.]|nr:M10 family metallopeptidase [Desulfuromonas sp.]
MATQNAGALLDAVLTSTGAKLSRLFHEVLEVRLQSAIDVGITSNLALAAVLGANVQIAETLVGAANPLFRLMDIVDQAKTTAWIDDNTDDLLVSALNASVVISGIDSDSLLPLYSPTVSALYDGDSWLNFQNSTDSITYSFNETLPSEYSWSDTRDWQTVGTHARNVIDEIMSLVDGVILPDIERVFGNGQIRFNMVETAQDVAAYAYYPGSGVGGDVFLGHDIGTNTDSGNIEPFGEGRSSIVHEIGHALGLTHPFEGVSVLPASADHSANTVMSYTDYRPYISLFTGAKTGSGGSQVELDYASVAPDRFMLYDIAALQAVYCPDPDYRVGDDTYVFGDVPFYTTIWDAGGHDVLNFSDTSSYNIIDLTPGSHSHINYRDIDIQIADQQEVYRQQLNTSHWDDWVAETLSSISSDLYTGENALGIAWGTIIEEVIGGPAGNWIIDNAVDNYLTGGVGDDHFYLGAGGFDRVIGGGGYDLVVLDQYARHQVELGAYEDSMLLVGDEFAVQMTGIAGIKFMDQMYIIA